LGYNCNWGMSGIGVFVPLRRMSAIQSPTLFFLSLMKNFLSIFCLQFARGKRNCLFVFIDILIFIFTEFSNSLKKVLISLKNVL
jgi:hypothetical protein